ncbi:hypothetical protein AK812_SmicGene44937 [Symbiodinium microadriaticum]|uniref:Uncharacterized protein n=1 Tax=Symbiodinium microadriaticum TaxID=2951 RepID=A0A1Q9BXC8_SYMMI|nr:hypothetical protein AK812_SmicGene44937 [Symbiodinium microadriaticum]
MALQARQSRGCSEAQARTSRGEVFGGRPSTRSRDPRHLAIALNHTGRQERRTKPSVCATRLRRLSHGSRLAISCSWPEQDLEPAVLPTSRTSAIEASLPLFLVEGCRLNVPMNVKNQDAALEHLPRRERCLVVLAQAIGFESAAWGVRITHEHTSCTARRSTLQAYPLEALKVSKVKMGFESFKVEDEEQRFTQQLVQ